MIKIIDSCLTPEISISLQKHDDGRQYDVVTHDTLLFYYETKMFTDVTEAVEYYHKTLDWLLAKYRKLKYANLPKKEKQTETK